MKLPLIWLNDYVDTKNIPIKQYCDRMTDTGSKVEGWEELGADIDNVVIGEILKITKHENSDHLLICEVNTGSKILQIVTGASNVFEGAVVPVAVAPAILPGGVKIKPGKLRGVKSEGMLCSAGELGLTAHDIPGSDSDGILILGGRDEPCCGADLTIGRDIADALLMRDHVVEFEITSNRPDCLSVIGLARETAASFDLPLTNRESAVMASTDDALINYLAVEIENTKKCPRYTARVVKNVKIAPSPLWMRMRLRAAGVRPINNIVDITNYVMLEHGQPMHAFDYACLDGNRIVVRSALDGEKFTTLDGAEHTLKKEHLVIADAKRPVALAGVMGGENSEIKDETVTVVFESANFEPVTVRRAAQSLGMRTESSSRFEKGLDRENTLRAVERACELVNLLGAGDVVNGIIDVYPGRIPQTELDLDAGKINRLLGTDLDGEYMAEILRRLEFKVDGSRVTVPAHRADVTNMNDLAEEIARIYGYNEIPSSYLKGEITGGGRNPRQKFEDDLHGAMTGAGYYEACTYSFISPKSYERTQITVGADEQITIKNPLGADTSVMRVSAIPSMAAVLSYNRSRGNKEAALYEIATVYLARGEDELPDEKRRLVIGIYGAGRDFYSIKSICEYVLDFCGIEALFRANQNSTAFHPGRCADVVINTADGGEEVIGTIGELHPTVIENYDLPGETGGLYGTAMIADLDIDKIFSRRIKNPRYRPLPKYPAIERDFSFICSEEFEVGGIIPILRESGGELFENAEVFDIYRSSRIGAGKKSVSFRVTLRAANRTLTLDEADRTASVMLENLSRKFEIELRK